MSHSKVCRSVLHLAMEPHTPTRVIVDDVGISGVRNSNSNRRAWILYNVAHTNIIETNMHTQTERETDRQTERERKRERARERERGRERHKHTHIHTRVRA